MTIITIADLEEQRRLDHEELEKIRGGRIKQQNETVDEVVKEIVSGGNTFHDVRSPMTVLW